MPASAETLEAQRDEVQVLESIYGDDYVPLSEGDPFRFQILCSVDRGDPSKPLTLRVPGDALASRAGPSQAGPSTGAGPSTASGDLRPGPGIERTASSGAILTVQHLAPIRLTVEFGPEYPATAPPSLELSASWLTRGDLRRLAARLDALFVPGAPVVFEWAEWLKSESLAFLDARPAEILLRIAAAPEGDGEEDDERVDSECGGSVQAAMLQLLRHSVERENALFERVEQRCPVCMEEKPGRVCKRLPCRHVACNDCLAHLCNLFIGESAVFKLRCPDPEGKCREPLPPWMVKALVDGATFAKYEEVMLEKTIDALGDMVYCPRCEEQGTRTPVIEETGNSGRCTRCFFAFCTLCHDAWHAGACMSTEQRLAAVERRRKEAGARRASAVGKDAAEQRRRELALYQELLTRKYMAQIGVRQCPNCQFPIEKTEGCNKMTCFNCNKFFCWKCNQIIDGYDHFGDGSCVMFDQEEINRWNAQMNAMNRAIMNVGVPRRGDQLPRGRVCPVCNRFNPKVDQNNHIRCLYCRHGYCYTCGARVQRTAAHFTGAGCRQHSDD
eukprot:tig00021428_g21171.t1